MRVLKNMAIYMGGSMANQLVALVVLPILTRYLSPGEYGSVALFTAFVGFAAPVVGMSMKTHIARNFFKVTRERMAHISWNTFIAVTANLLVLAGLSVGLAAAFPATVDAVVGLSALWIAVALLTAWAQSVSAHLTTFLRVQGRPLPYASFEFLFAGFNLALSLFFVVACGWGWRGRAAGFAVSAAAAAVAAVTALRRMGYLAGRVEGGLMRHLYRICLPLVPHAFAGQITTMSSRFFLNGIAGLEAVGLYAVGHTFGTLVNMPVDAFNNAWTPWVYKRLAAHNSQSDREIARVWLLVSAGLVALWLFMVAAAPLALRWITNPRYHSAEAYIGWVALAFALQGMYVLLTPILIDEGKTDALAIISFAVAGTSLALNYGLIHLAGGLGAAYTLVLCSGLRLALVFAYLRRVRPMPWLTAFARNTP
jgi:O-antigen/teichoic acid export membrane protein